MNRLFYYITLCRPANVITAMADVLAGSSIALFYSNIADTENVYPHIALLLIATAALYAGGIVFNDIFDAGTDRIERPERMIPSGRISKKSATIFGTALFIIALTSSALVNGTALLIAGAIALSAFLYDSKSKQHPIAGPLTMGLCRGLNLLLGISLMPPLVTQELYLGIVPLVYIFAVTTISRDEVHGGKRRNLAITFILYLLVFIILGIVGCYTKAYTGLLLLLPFFISIMRPLFKAWQNPQAKNIVRAVKAGVLSIILLDATWAAVHHQFVICGIILCLLPLSILLGKYFAVT
ncbi:UbiA-like protein EboC [Niabella sp. CC-SYL272]|uniref:UbiA-like protein EboC n=1 Tax=Niabella agricola TaxID=2891571 RepID=UPI001F3B17A5|nr:UbiA-like protein EboC [Niabella agricola]MCF3108774.1 UbiA-like protein EboC [Niabella agricola]